jgi:tetratricopeptide (TPR) repeat protein
LKQCGVHRFQNGGSCGTRALGAAFAMLCCLPSIAAVEDPRERLLAEANSAYRSLHAAEAASLYRQYLAIYPDRADVRVYLGGALLNLDQLQPALEEARHAIALDARYAKGYILAGRVCAARGQSDLAQDYFDKAQRVDSRDPDAFYFSGRAYYDANRFERAIEAFEHALRLDSAQSRVYENLGLAQDALGQFASAEESFRKAVELARRAWRPYLAYGAFLFRQAREAESLSALRQALEIEPAAAEVRFELARVLYHGNRLEEAARVLEPALASDECRVHHLAVRIYSASGDTGAADTQVQAMAHCKAAGDHP